MNVEEFSKRVDLSSHTIRYYEKIGLLREVQRLPKGHRHFCEKDVQWIAFVQRLKETGMPLEQIHQYSDLRAQGDSTLLARQKILEIYAQTLKERIAQQQEHLNKLHHKIAFYQLAIAQKKDA